jgi:hypothetical protein
MRRLVLIALLAGWASVALHGAHPCDTAPVGPWTWRTGRSPVVGWCQEGAHDGFIVSFDGRLFDIGKPAPAVPGTGTRGVYYHVGWPTNISKGSHSFSVRAYTATGGMQGPATVLSFTRQ